MSHSDSIYNSLCGIIRSVCIAEIPELPMEEVKNAVRTSYDDVYLAMNHILGIMYYKRGHMMNAFKYYERAIIYYPTSVSPAYLRFYRMNLHAQYMVCNMIAYGAPSLELHFDCLGMERLPVRSHCIPHHIRDYCSYCSRSSIRKLKKCAGCRGVVYCGKECQRAHWEEHKVECM